MHLRDLTQFLAELSENNQRAWFVMNKPRYDILRAEFLELVAALIADLSRFDPTVAGCDPKKALFRINRDLRFATDRRPYKTHFSAAITATGLKKPSQGGGPAYYFHINARGELLLAVGEHLPPPARLRAIRQHIVRDPASFAAMLADRPLRTRFGTLQDNEKLSRAPKGFNPASPEAEFLKLKSYILRRAEDVRNGTLPGYPAGTPVADSLRALLRDSWKDGLPLVRWLRSVPTATQDD